MRSIVPEKRGLGKDIPDKFPIILRFLPPPETSKKCRIWDAFAAKTRLDESNAKWER
jgi:hypothetical protein